MRLREYFYQVDEDTIAKKDAGEREKWLKQEEK